MFTSTHARLVVATAGGVRVVSVCVPNGGDPGSDKYAYKLRWLDRLVDYLERSGVPDAPLALCGDFNIVPEDRDAHDPGMWEGTVVYNAEVRGACV